MSTVAENLNRIISAKSDIRTAIIDMGVDVSETDRIETYADKIKSIKSKIDVAECGLKFGNSKGLSPDLDFTNCTDLSKMFVDIKFETGDINNFSTIQPAHPVILDECFRRTDSYLNKVDFTGIGNWDTSSVTSMIGCFKGADEVNEGFLDEISKWDFSGTTTMEHTFSSFNTRNPIADWSSLNINSSNCENFESCFSHNMLTKAPNVDTSKATRLYEMYEHCQNLTDIPAYDATNATNTQIFSDGNILKQQPTNVVNFGGLLNAKVGYSVKNMTKLSVDSLVNILNGLYDYVAAGETPASQLTATMTLGATNLAKLSDEQKAIATSKGWTLY